VQIVSKFIQSIVRSKIAAGSANHVVINDGSGNLSSEAQLALSRGGTGQSTKAAAFDALQPMTTGGDLIYGGASGTGTRLANGTAGQVLTSAGGTAAPAWSTPILKNYVTNGSAELDTAGWATYANTAQATPVDGTGGSPSVTWTRTTSSPLIGTASFLFTKDAVNRQGQGASYDFTIDSAYQAKVINISMIYSIASGTYANGDLTIYIYDVTNSQVIQPAGYSISNVNGSLVQNATFQTNSNSTSYRLIFHVASTSASAYTVKFDNVVVGPQIITQGTPVTDWTAYTPTLNSNTSVSTNIAYYRRVGDSLEVEGQVTYNGAGNASTFTVSLPSGLSMDTAKIAAASTGVLGNGYWSDSGTGFFDLIIRSNTSTTIAAYQTSGTASFNTTVIANGDTLNYKFTVPIVGWSSQVQMSSDTDTRVVAAVYQSTAGTAYGNGPTTLATATKVVDTHGAFSSNIFTCPVSGTYSISVAMVLAGTITTTQLAQIRANRNNGTIYSLATTSGNGANANYGVSGEALIPLNAGDTLKVEVITNTAGNLTEQTLNSAATQININRLSGPSQIAASDTVEATYTVSAGTSLTAATPATIIYATKVTDTNGAYNTSTGVFTAPISGKYLVSASLASANVAWTNNQEFGLYFRRNSTDLYIDTQFSPGSFTTLMQARHSHVIQLLAGETITIRGYSDVTHTTNSSGTRNALHIIRVGNY
jgi:hypothetical protein